MGFSQPSPASIAVYSHVRQAPAASQTQSSSDPTQLASVLQNSRAEILRLIELMVDKNQHEVQSFIVEVNFLVGSLHWSKNWPLSSGSSLSL